MSDGYTGAWCPQCGVVERVDEDGLCLGCGATAVGAGAERALATARLVPRIVRLIEGMLDQQEMPDDHGGEVPLVLEALAELRRDGVPRARAQRQKAVAKWVEDTFGSEVMEPVERATRVLEETLELAQAAGVPGTDVLRLFRRVYDRPIGALRQEVGGVGVTLLAFCESVGIDADQAESDEFDRARGKPCDEMRARHQSKVEAGLAAPMGPPRAGGQASSRVTMVLQPVTPEMPADLLRKLVTKEPPPLTNAAGERVGQAERLWFDEWRQALMAEGTLDDSPAARRLKKLLELTDTQGPLGDYRQR